MKTHRLAFVVVLLGICCVLLIVIFISFQNQPDFSKSDWYVEHSFDGSGQGTKIYWKTSNKYSIGDIVNEYYIIARYNKYRFYKLLPIRVQSIKRYYIVAEFPVSKLNSECMSIITDEGDSVNAVERVYTDWFPIPGWGKECRNVNWKEEYQKILDEPTL